MQVYINSLGTAVPTNKIPQSKIGDFMSEAMELNSSDKVKLKVLYRATGIEHRHSVLQDYAETPSDFTFFPKNKALTPFPDIAQRMHVYEQEAIKLATQAIENALPKSFEKSKITHLITVSCTGMYAPGLDIDILQQMGFNSNVSRTAINFMGCYGAFNGLKLAKSICSSDQDAIVLLVAVELCTLHFQNTKDDDTLLANALFSDGAAAAMISSSPSVNSIELQGFHADIAYEGKEDMAWQIRNHGFEMKLSSTVPDIIEKHILTLTDRLLQQYKLTLDQIDLYAIHPGGKRILEVIEEQLGIERHKNEASHKVLKNYGNMSSPTVLFVLKHILDNLKDNDLNSKRILSFAFGPGLTIESMLLKIN